MPVNEEPVATERSDQCRREQREVREGRGVDDVVAAAPAKEVSEHSCSEEDWWQDPPAAAGVQLRPRGDGDDADSGDVRMLAVRPLAHREIGDLVPVLREPLSEVPIPALDRKSTRLNSSHSSISYAV